jgi:signal transduction histidine kinase
LKTGRGTGRVPPRAVIYRSSSQPSLEGKNLIDLRDAKGRPIVREEIAAAMKDGTAWVDLYWYKPGSNSLAPKQTYLRKVQSGPDTYVVGWGLYVEE